MDSRAAALAGAQAHFDSGAFLRDLSRRVAIRTESQDPASGPLLIATRHEDDKLPTVLVYGHGDVIRGQDASWTKGAGPWTVAVRADGDSERWYGRGTADNKGQHSINFAALAHASSSAPMSATSPAACAPTWRPAVMPASK